MIKPIAISSTNHTLLQNLAETYSKVSRLFDVSSLWSSSSAEKDKDKADGKTEDEAKKITAEATKDAPARKGSAGPPPVKPKRPGQNKRMPSERPMSVRDFEVVSRAEKR